MLIAGMSPVEPADAIGRLQSGLEQSAKARDVLAGVEGRGSCQPGLLHILGIKLSKTSTDRLAGGYGLGHELNGLIAISCLNGDRFAPLNRDQQRLERACMPHNRRQWPDHCHKQRMPKKLR